MTGNKSLIDLSDVAGLSQPLTKLVESVGDAAGAIYEPTKIVRKAKADAKAGIILAEANDKKTEIEGRTQERVHNREVRRQKNIESITKNAAGALSDVEEVSDDPVSEDWIYRFFDECQDISDQEMQSLWGNILAGEVIKPGSFSFRTLRILKDLSKQEAELFTRVCSFTWLFSEPEEDTLVPVITSVDDDYVLKKKINFTALKDLESIGLIHFEDNLNFPKLTNINAFYYGKLHILECDTPSNLALGIAMFTPVGKELFPVSNAPGDNFIRNSIVQYWKEQGWNVTAPSILVNKDSE